MASDSRLSSSCSSTSDSNSAPPMSRMGSKFLVRKATPQGPCSPSPVEDLSQNWISFWSFFSCTRSSPSKALADPDTSWKPPKGKRSPHHWLTDFQEVFGSESQNVDDTTKYCQKRQHHIFHGDEKLKPSSYLGSVILAMRRFNLLLLLFFFNTEILAQSFIDRVLPTPRGWSLASNFYSSSLHTADRFYNITIRWKDGMFKFLQTSTASERKRATTELNKYITNVSRALQVFITVSRDYAVKNITKLSQKLRNHLTHHRISSRPCHTSDFNAPSFLRSCKFRFICGRTAMSSFLKTSPWFSVKRCWMEQWLPTKNFSITRLPILRIITLLLACLPTGANAGQHERRLLSDLLGNYNPLERPVANESEPVQVSFGITLQQIIDVDEKNQILTTNVWLNMEWNDVNLQWNESDYGNVKDLRIPPYKIWKPDVLMYNSADEGFDGTYQTKVVVSSNGNCLYIPPGIFKSTCKIDITWFPFDDQKCKMKFGSWTYSGWQLDLQLQSEEGGDLSDFIKNGEWDLIGCPGKRNAIYYQCCPEPYVDVTFEIMIRRRTLYYFCNLILPCVLIASMAVLGFTLPPDCGEKLSLEITILLSLTLFLNMVSATTPATSESVPLIGTYFNCIMFMVASSVVSTVLILNYHHRSADTHEMSPMVRSMFLQWLPWVLRMHRPGEKITRKTIMMNNKMKELELKCPPSFQERSSKSLLANVLDIDDDFRAHTLPHPGHTTNNSTSVGGIMRIPHTGHSVDDTHLVHTCMSQCTRELNLILKEIKVITDKLRKDDEEYEVTNDWRFAAMVVDRMCLIVFTLFTVTATVAVLLSAPHIMVP
ncbi:acetylcholine receptor subunit alpha-type acr-16 [Hyalella azteca]|uniref:Acetylcholine receptor subunit alpha-type acr-16 n=1 Tax=Hyalella azteca TaxID=294128 RepID=A0A8B7PB12_HYAAZ|nr:acetylcholine receptor subunit alpha-type acr-16 [Hyalella azteca]